MFLVLQSPSSSEMAQDLQQFHDCVGNVDVWEAEHGDHARWVTDLCAALLQSGAVTDLVLSLLQPVCQMKVCPFNQVTKEFLTK